MDSSCLSLTLFSCLLICFITFTLKAQETPTSFKKSPRDSIYFSTMSDNPNDPENLLMTIQQRRSQKEALFIIPKLVQVNQAMHDIDEKLHETAYINLGLAFTHVFQWLSEAPLGDHVDWGTATTMDFLAAWELVDRGGPKHGQIFLQVQGRWTYGTTGPEDLGEESLGSLGGTANTFSGFSPILLVRNFYWQQGSEEAGWIYRIGKITPDSMLSTSAHIASPMTFLPTSGTGAFANALTDSGLGIAAVWYINDRLKLLGIFSDANANRYNLGNITAGDFYKALELGVKIAPKTEKAGYSKITLWHTDATEDGQAVNGHLGPEGWGFFLKHEQELSTDGNAIMVLRYGKSFNKSAFYRDQAGASFLLYNPTGVTRLENDVVGVAATWVQSNIEGARGETGIELFYRFPILPKVDISFSYQGIINPALDPNNGYASAYSVRLRTSF